METIKKVLHLGGSSSNDSHSTSTSSSGTEAGHTSALSGMKAEAQHFKDELSSGERGSFGVHREAGEDNYIGDSSVGQSMKDEAKNLTGSSHSNASSTRSETGRQELDDITGRSGVGAASSRVGSSDGATEPAQAVDSGRRDINLGEDSAASSAVGASSTGSELGGSSDSGRECRSLDSGVTSGSTLTGSQVQGDHSSHHQHPGHSHQEHTPFHGVEPVEQSSRAGLAFVDGQQAVNKGSI